MSRPKLTRELAFAASLDGGNRSMRPAGRQSWNKQDKVSRYENLIASGLNANTK